MLSLARRPFGIKNSVFHIKSSKSKQWTKNNTALCEPLRVHGVLIFNNSKFVLDLLFKYLHGDRVQTTNLSGFKGQRGPGKIIIEGHLAFIQLINSFKKNLAGL